MVSVRPSTAEVWTWLNDVADPEIPVISICDLGIVRDVSYDDDASPARLVVTITPTYSGCPAMRTIEADIRAALAARGVEHAAVRSVLSPAWTTDWLTETGREKLRAYGISPPRVRAADPGGAIDLVGYVDERAACPRCGDTAVTLASRFGSTPCKSLYVCTVCKEPFDHFKSH